MQPARNLHIREKASVSHRVTRTANVLTSELAIVTIRPNTEVKKTCIALLTILKDPAQPLVKGVTFIVENKQTFFQSIIY